MYEKRLVATAVSIFSIGVAVGIYVNNRNTLIACAVFALLAMVSLVTFVIFSKSNSKIVSKRITAAAFAVAALSLGALRVSVGDAFASNLKIYHKCEDIATVKVTEISNNYVDVKIKDSDCGVPKNTGVRLYTNYYNDELAVGDLVDCQLKYSYVNTNSLRSKGIILTSSVDITNVEKGSGLLYSIRESVDKNNEILFGKFQYAAGISKGVTIGDRSDISSYVYAIYRNSGISHLLAISGLHISIIVLSMYNLLVYLSVNRKIANTVAICISLVFAALTGFSVGALRSVIMICFAMVYGLFLEKSDSFTSLSFALLLFLLINPYAICSIGLQLSFLCSLGILLSSPILDAIDFKLSLKSVKSRFCRKWLYKLLKLIAIPFITSLIASVFSFPVAFWNYNSTSSIAPIINVFTIPMFTVGIVLSVAAYLIAPLSLAIASVCAYPAGRLFEIATGISQSVYNSNSGVVSIRTPMALLPLVVAVCGIVVLVKCTRNRNAVAMASFLLFGLSVVIMGTVNVGYEKRSNILEYGNEDSQYIFCASGQENLYIDIGGYTVNPQVVYETGSVCLKNYVMLNYDARNYQNLDYMTAQIKVENLILPIPRNDEEIVLADRIKVLANERNCDIITYSEDCRVELTDMVVGEIVGNGADISQSTTVYIKFGDYTIQMLGDGFENYARCDYAILSDKCKTDVSDIDAKRIYVQKGFADKSEQKFNNLYEFDKRLKMEINIEERDCRIYEP